MRVCCGAAPTVERMARLRVTEQTLIAVVSLTPPLNYLTPCIAWHIQRQTHGVIDTYHHI